MERRRAGAAERCLSPPEEGLRQNIFGDSGTSPGQVVSWTVKLPGAWSNLEGLLARGQYSYTSRLWGAGCSLGVRGGRTERLGKQSGGNLGSSARFVNVPEKLRLKIMRRCD